MFVNHGLYVREALEAVGWIDEEAFAFYHADGDIGLRLAEHGYACVQAPDSYIEHYADANPVVRESNLARQQADWAAYSDRWGRLGAPARDWIDTRHDDPYRTARRYWGPLLTSRTYRLAQRLVPAVRRRLQPRAR
jgi:GT2 family glycosyltransferase